MAIGDVYVLRDQMTFIGQQLENRYFVQHVLGLGGFASLGAAWAAGPQTNVKASTSVGNTFIQMDITNLDDTTDFGVVASTGNGTRAGELMPPYSAWALRLQTADLRIRSGGKRYGGISETDQLNGARTGTIITVLDALETALNSTFSNGGDTFKIVLHTPGNVASGGLRLEVAISSVTYVSLSTQSSRKFT